jgi:hypothetical protein
MITEDDEFDRIEREIKYKLGEPMSAKPEGEPLVVVYTVKLTQSQRIKLMQLGGPKWIREQIEKAKK